MVLASWIKWLSFRGCGPPTLKGVADPLMYIYSTNWKRLSPLHSLRITSIYNWIQVLGLCNARTSRSTSVAAVLFDSDRVPETIRSSWSHESGKFRRELHRSWTRTVFQVCCTENESVCFVKHPCHPFLEIVFGCDLLEICFIRSSAWQYMKPGMLHFLVALFQC